MFHDSRRVSTVLVAVAALVALAGCGRFKSKRAAGRTTLTSDTSSTTSTTGASTSRTAGDEDRTDERAGRATVSCNSKSSDGMCAEWSGLDDDETKDAQGSCTRGSVFSQARCPEDNLLATCEHKEEHVKMFLYKSAVVNTVQGAKELCEEGDFTVNAAALPRSQRH